MELDVYVYQHRYLDTHTNITHIYTDNFRLEREESLVLFYAFLDNLNKE